MFWETEYGDYIGLNFTVPAHNITLYTGVWKCTYIKTLEDFIDFSKVVNSGADMFEGTTVFLDSDLSLAGKTFEPIGTSYSKYFLGVFDGQGHVISNLVMNSSSRFAGLFGYSEGMAIRNVVLDSSCSIASSFCGSDDAFVGGFIGRYDPRNGPCIIENLVNMASVSFTGNIRNGYLHLGGIAGYFYSYSHEITVKNCASYGDVTDSGVSRYSYVGGISGYSYGYSSKRVYIYNSLNYGTITHSGTSSDYLYIGGIAGCAEYTSIENCVSAGKIEPTGAASNNYTGSIVGYAYSDTSINYCYFTNELNSLEKYAGGTPSESNTTSYDIITFELNDSVTIGDYKGTSLIGVLNSAADSNADYSNWLLNKNSNTVTFTINGRTSAAIKMNYQIILLPSLASEGNMSFVWYEDSEYITQLTSYEVTSDTKLYSLYGVIFTVTFDKNGGEGISFASKKVVYSNTYGEFPEASKTGYTLTGWFTEKTGGNKVESGSIVTANGDHTLYAQWTINKYTLTFDFGNGTVNSVVFDFNETIEYPDDPTRDGHIFAGWKPRPERMPAENKTLYAKWTITESTEYVEIIFSEKDLTEEEIRDIIKEFVPEGAEFEIARIEDDSEGTRAIVRFDDKEEAKSFIEKVTTSSDSKSIIVSIGVVPGDSFSSSLSLNFLVLFCVMLQFF